MNEPIKKPEHTNPETYSPKEPKIAYLMKKALENNVFIPHESGTFSYRYDYLELPESLKFVGTIGNGEPVSETENWHNFDKSLINNKVEPLIGIRLWQNATHQESEWTCGCLVDAITSLPEKIFGVDTGWKRFCVLTILCSTVEGLYEGEDHFKWAHGIGTQSIPEIYKPQIVAPPVGVTRGFAISNGASTSILEVYPTSPFNTDGKPEMSFYYPLINH